MRARSVCLWSLLLLAVLIRPVGSKSFPDSPDVTLSEQQRWGASSRGYVQEGCWHGASATTSISLQSCRAYALDDYAGTPVLKGWQEETARTLTYSGGDGTYWLGGRTSPALAPAGWTCLPGTHYCWIKGDTLSTVPTGLVLLGRSTVAAGAITQFTILAPWKRTTPYTVPSGVTLTFGVCPEAGGWQIFEANESSSGAVRFAPGACGLVWPEWWGVDPTGVRDSTAAWQLAIDATTLPEAGPYTPLRCEGTYAISAASGQLALTVRRGTQIRGTYRKATHPPGSPGYPCLFKFTGAGTALGTLDTGGSIFDMAFSDLTIIDSANTGDFGLLFYRPASIAMDNVSLYGFAIAGRFVSNTYYGKISQLKSRNPRTRCFEFTGNNNNVDIDVHCNAADVTTLTAGVAVGDTEGLQGTSYQPRFNILSEVASGTPAILNLIRGGDVTVYVETPGVCADFDQEGVIKASGWSGGRLAVRLNRTCEGTLPVGLRLYDRFLSSPGFENVVVTGQIATDGYTDPVLVVRGKGVWGNDLTGLALSDGAALRAGDYTTGVKIADNVMTHGLTPLVDEGRGDATNNSAWRQGDMIWQRVGTSTAPPVLTNTLAMVHQGGDPPQLTFMTLPTTSPVTAADGDQTPSLLRGQVVVSRVLLEASAAAITNFDDGPIGHCITVRALGNRTVNDGPNIELNGSAAFAMNAGDMLHLCNEAGIWREIGRGDNN